MAGLPWEVLYPKRIAVVLTGAAQRLDGAEGRHPLRRRPAHRLRRHQRDRRIHRPRRAHDQRHRQGDDHQHGRRARRDDLDVSRRRADGDYLRATGRGELVPLVAATSAICWSPTPRSRRIPRSTTTACSSSTCRSSSRTSSGRTRPTARGRSRSSPPRSREREQRVPRPDLHRAHRQLHQLLVRGHEPRRRRRRAGASARRRGRRLPFMVTPGSEQIRATIERDGQMRSLHGHRRHRARQRLRPLHRPVASGRRRGAPEHHRHLVQPQLPGRNDGQRDDDELHRQPRDRHRVRARRAAVVQSARPTR